MLSSTAESVLLTDSGRSGSIKATYGKLRKLHLSEETASFHERLFWGLRGLGARISIPLPPSLFSNLTTLELVVLWVCILQNNVIRTSATPKLSPGNLAAGPAEQLITRDCLFTGL